MSTSSCVTGTQDVTVGILGGDVVKFKPPHILLKESVVSEVGWAFTISKLWMLVVGQSDMDYGVQRWKEV